MSSGHLLIGSTGHLLRSVVSGHFLLNLPTTYTLVNQLGAKWSGWADVNIPVSEITGTQVVTLVNNALAQYSAKSGSYINYTYASIAASYGGIGYTAADCTVYGAIMAVTPQSGRSFGAPRAASLVIDVHAFCPPYQSEWPTTGGNCGIGTGNTAPTGDPRSWNANLFSGGVGTSTLTDVALGAYIWMFSTISPWSGQASDLRGDGGRGIECYMTATGIKDY